MYQVRLTDKTIMYTSVDPAPSRTPISNNADLQELRRIGLYLCSEHTTLEAKRAAWALICDPVGRVTFHSVSVLLTGEMVRTPLEHQEGDRLWCQLQTHVVAQEDAVPGIIDCHC